MFEKCKSVKLQIGKPGKCKNCNSAKPQYAKTSNLQTRKSETANLQTRKLMKTANLQNLKSAKTANLQIKKGEKCKFANEKR